MFISSFKSFSFSPFSTIIVFTLFSFIGLLIIPKLSIQLLPNQTYSSVSVFAILHGASTEVTELELTSPLEGAISRLKGVSKISSISDNGYCQIKVELNKWADPSSFRIDLVSLIRQLYPKLPDNTSYPQIILNSPEDNGRYQPLISIALSNGNKDINSIAHFAEETIRPYFSDIKGIKRTDVIGNRLIRKVIEPDLAKLALIGINVSDLQQQLQQALRSNDLGQLTIDNKRIVLYLSKVIKSDVDISNFIVGNIDGRIFRLKDIATISNDRLKPETLSRTNGKEQIELLFYADSKINTIELSKRIKDKFEDIDLKKLGYHCEIQTDQATLIKNELDTMYLRTILSILLLLLFVILITRNFRYILIVLVCLIANVSISCIFYFLFRLDIHLYSIAGISISLGLVIDNVLVIIEDLKYHKRNRIFAAILASTLTAMASLSVVFLLEESQKILLVDFALAVFINLVVSLAIAYFFIPALLNVFPVDKKQRKGGYGRKKIIIRCNKIFEQLLIFTVRYKKWMIVLTILLFGLPIYLLPVKLDKGNSKILDLYNLTIGSELYNKSLREPLNEIFGGITYQYFKKEKFFSFARDNTDKRTQVIVDIKMPMGVNFDQIDDISKEFEKLFLLFVQDIKVFTTNIYNSRFARIQVLFKEDVQLPTVLKIKSIIEEKSILSGAADFSIHGVGDGFDNALDADVFDSAISLKGYNFKQLQILALQVRDSLMQNDRVGEVMISSKREWEEVSDYIHIARFTKSPYLVLNGVGKWSIGNSLNNILSSWSMVGEYEKAEDNITSPIFLALNTDNEPDMWKVKYWSLSINDSTSTKSSAVSSISKIKIGSQMVRENQEYILYVNYRFVGNHQLNKLMAAQIINNTSEKLPFGYKIEGEILKDSEKNDYQYILFIPLVLFIIYLMCAILLESLKKPFAIIATIPFSYIGVFLIFILLGLHFGNGGYVALFMLSSIATNAALYITNDLNFIGKNKNSSIRLYIKALNLKVMPVLITTLSAILSLVPFMVLGQENSFWYTMSAGTIGGLFFSLLAIFTIFPILVVSKTRNIKHG